MDLLCLPQIPSLPAERTLYVCRERYDGGPFLTYAHRKGKTRSLPPQLRDESVADPYLEVLHPSPQEEQQRFYQTWLFFGLLAEFLSLNKQNDGTNLIESSIAKKELSELYVDYLFLENGNNYIQASKILKCQPLIVSRIREARVPARDRLSYLTECLRFAHIMLNSIHTEFDDSIRYSIAGLGELFSFTLYPLFQLWKLDRPHIAFPWGRGYLEKNKVKMLQAGWCPSDIERASFTYLGLNTQHLLSHMKKFVSGRSHLKCTKRQCQAFQIDLQNYKLAHAKLGCECTEIGIDMRKVFHILQKTSSFPLLRINVPEAGEEGLQISVEEHKRGVPYVALSHVWADGLGNPKNNTLQRCQVVRLATLVTQLEGKFKSVCSLSGPKYLFWIDTLCCPVEPNVKKIALERITNVYRNATHVLVLDASISSYPAEGIQSAELLLRIFGSSAWMRRLWTLQECALANSLYFQFADGPVSALHLHQNLFKIGRHDARYQRICIDMTVEFARIRSFFGDPLRGQYDEKFVWLVRSISWLAKIRASMKWHHVIALLGSLVATSISNLKGMAYIAIVIFASLWSYRKYASHRGTIAKRPKRNLYTLEQALQYRTVTVPSDEALCIATLMSLDIKEIIHVENEQERMVMVWRLIAGGLNGIPSRIIFFVDNNLDISGWRWAPRSLLGSGSDQSMDTFQRWSRFSQDGAKSKYWGSIHQLGIRVQFPGFVLIAKPRAPGMPLHPWRDIEEQVEDRLLFQDPRTKRWYSFFDTSRGLKLATWSREERHQHDKSAGSPLCKAIHEGGCALIRDPVTPYGVMVQVSKDANQFPVADRTDEFIYARIQRRVTITELNPSERFIAETLRKIAEQLTQEEMRQGLPPQTDAGGDANEGRLDRVRQRMKDLIAEEWDSKPEFAAAMKNTFSPNKDYVWKLICRWFSHEIVVEEKSADQVWIVD